MDVEQVGDGSPTSGRLAATISTEVVSLIASWTGRGPTRARTTLSGRWVFVTLEDTLTRGERQLANSGYSDSVLVTRRQYQTAMRTELNAIVERVTGRRVEAFMSDNHIDPDVAIEAFLLSEPTVT